MGFIGHRHSLRRKRPWDVNTDFRHNGAIHCSPASLRLGLEEQWGLECGQKANTLQETGLFTTKEPKSLSSQCCHLSPRTKQGLEQIEDDTRTGGGKALRWYCSRWWTGCREAYHVSWTLWSCCRVMSLSRYIRVQLVSGCAIRRQVTQCNNFVWEGLGDTGEPHLVQS